MLGAGLKIIDRSRPVYSLAPNKLTFTVPATAQVEDILFAMLVHKVGEGFTLPTGWTSFGAEEGVTNAAINYIARVRSLGDPDTLAVALLAVTDEWQGQLVVIRGGAIGTLRETSGSQAFAADATPDSPSLLNHQPMNLALCAISVATNVDLGAPAGFTALDEYNTAVVSSRSLLVAWKQTKSHQNYNTGTGTANPAATGRTFVFLARERPPLTPAVLEDPVPGNIGLLPA